MNGPEHYREAERLLNLAGDLPAALVALDRDLPLADLETVKRDAERALGGKPVVLAGPGVSIDVTPTLLAAQAHATLAAAAAAVTPDVFQTEARQVGEWFDTLEGLL